MKLYQIPNRSKLKVKTSDGIKDAIFDHPDGLYSYCYLVEDESKIFHLSILTPMKKVGDHYEIKE